MSGTHPDVKDDDAEWYKDNHIQFPNCAGELRELITKKLGYKRCFSSSFTVIEDLVAFSTFILREYSAIALVVHPKHKFKMKEVLKKLKKPDVSVLVFFSENISDNRFVLCTHHDMSCLLEWEEVSSSSSSFLKPT